MRVLIKDHWEYDKNCFSGKDADKRLEEARKNPLRIDEDLYQGARRSADIVRKELIAQDLWRDVEFLEYSFEQDYEGGGVVVKAVIKVKTPSGVEIPGKCGR